MLVKLQIFPPVLSDIKPGTVVGCEDNRLILTNHLSTGESWWMKDELFIATGTDYVKHDYPTVIVEEEVFLNKQKVVIRYHGYLIKEYVVFISCMITFNGNYYHFLCIRGISWFVYQSEDEIDSLPSFLTQEFGIKLSTPLFQNSLGHLWYSPKNADTIESIVNTAYILSDQLNNVSDDWDEKYHRELLSGYFLDWYERDNRIISVLPHSYLSIFGCGVIEINHIIGKMDRRNVKELLSGEVTETDAALALVFPTKESISKIPLIKDIFNHNVTVNEIPNVSEDAYLMTNGGSLNPMNDKVEYTDWLSQSVSHPQLIHF